LLPVKRAYGALGGRDQTLPGLYHESVGRRRWSRYPQASHRI